MTTILVLYPGTIGFRQREAKLQRAHLRDRGVRLALADDYLVDTDRAAFDEVIELPPPEHVREACSVLDGWRASNTIDAVWMQSEAALLAGSLTCDALGLPGIAPRAALACANKFLSRCELERAGVPQPSFALARDAHGVRAFARRPDIGYPIVLKGVASTLGRLVTLVRDESAIDAAVAHVTRGIALSTDIQRLCEFASVAGFDLGCDPHRDFLVESFAHGDPVETDGLVVGRTARSLGVTQQVLTAPPLFFLDGYLNPADRSERELAEIESVSDAAIAALGVSNTGYSIEMRIRDGRVSVIEVNGRLGWDEGFSDLFAAASGRRPGLEALDLALGRRVDSASTPRTHAALAYASCYDDCTVDRLPGAHDIARIEASGVSIGLAVYVGCPVYAPPHPSTTPHLAYALATDSASSRAAYARARAAVDQLEFGFVAT